MRMYAAINSLHSFCLLFIRRPTYVCVTTNVYVSIFVEKYFIRYSMTAVGHLDVRHCRTSMLARNVAGFTVSSAIKIYYPAARRH